MSQVRSNMQMLVRCHLHQLIYLRHGLGVLDGGGGLGPVQVLNVLDPLVNNLNIDQ